jgi:hypothetical protein
MTVYVAGLRVTEHAAIRYRERVDQRLPVDAAAVAICQHERAIRAAVEFGCRSIKLGCGARLIIQHDAIVTVLAAGHRLPSLWSELAA